MKKAVLFLMSPELQFKMDYKGEYGLGPNTFYIPFNTKKEGLILEKFLKSEDYKQILNKIMLNEPSLEISSNLKQKIINYLPLPLLWMGWDSNS